MSPDHEQHWTSLGTDNPFWAVCTDPRYRGARLSGRDLAAFFESGERDEALLLDIVRALAPEFRPMRALDYGCGVGRLAIPLARASGEVLGVDISMPMLLLAEEHAARAGATNIRFLSAREFATAGIGTFDFVQSYIVFQHVPPREGMRITQRLLAVLAPGGLGALHYTFFRRASIARRSVNRLRRWVPALNWIANAVQRRPLREPAIPVYEYRVDQLLELLERHGCRDVRILLTDHGGHLGAIIAFRMPFV